MQPVVVRRVTISDAVAVAQLRHTALHDTPYAFAMSPAQLAHPTHHSWSELCARCSSGTNSIFVADTGHTQLEHLQVLCGTMSNDCIEEHVCYPESPMCISYVHTPYHTAMAHFA